MLPVSMLVDTLPVSPFLPLLYLLLLVVYTPMYLDSVTRRGWHAAGLSANEKGTSATDLSETIEFPLNKNRISKWPARSWTNVPDAAPVISVSSLRVLSIVNVSSISAAD